MALLAVAGALVLAGPAAAATTADTVTSQNWSGYAAHGSGTRFQTVTGRWRVPAASCVTGEQSFSSFWVGIGGYDEKSTGLEQTGTELDCSANGTETVSNWYELLPAGPHTLTMTVRSGDLISARVHLDGERVTLTIADLTRRETFTRTVRDTDVDDTSAEWIAEAPSDCTSDSDCAVLPLSDFGAVRFADATATTTGGVTSGISTRHWTTTKLLLGYRSSATGFIARATVATASPSALTDADREFEVTWSGTQVSSSGSGSAGSTGSGSGSSGSSGSGSGSSGSGSGSSGSGSSGTGATPNPGGGGDGPGNPGGAGPGGGDGPGAGDGPGGPGGPGQDS